jgi:hypothetical protein
MYLFTANCTNGNGCLEGETNAFVRTGQGKIVDRIITLDNGSWEWR